ncbi:MAG: hypothetical protein ACLS9K_02470 [Lachnospira eligens]
MLKTYGDAVITRAHFADRLVAIGAVGDRNEAFDRYLGQESLVLCQEPKLTLQKLLNVFTKPAVLQS